MKYHSLEELIAMIDEPNRLACLALYDDNKSLFDTAMGSAKKHQAWEGGYVDHITEVMNIAVVTYEVLNKCRKLPFSLSDALLTLFLHDIEKPWVYAKDPERRKVFHSEEHKVNYRIQLTKDYFFKLTSDHENALKYVHGELNDWHPTIAIQRPLGAFIHHCDNTSARIWPDCPKNKNDEWRDGGSS